MNRVERALRRIAADLEAADRVWCLIGGLAVSARAEPRTTRDVDVMVSVADDADAEGVIFSLQGVGYRVLTVLQQSATGRLATVRLLPPDEHERGVLVDLLFASSSIEPEIAAAAERLRVLPKLTVPVARIGHLMALKLLAHDDRRRPQDWDDARALLREASAIDIEEAREALRLIESRGAHRGKALLVELDNLLSEHAAERK
jgi:hypothetical protein